MAMSTLTKYWPELDGFCRIQIFFVDIVVKKSEELLQAVNFYLKTKEFINLNTRNYTQQT